MNREDWPWSDQEKRNYVWRNVIEAAQRNDGNTGIYKAYTVQDDGEYEPVFLDKNEQRVILQDFAVEEKIKLLEREEGDERNEHRFEILEPKRQRKSAYNTRISSVADLVKDIDLRNRVMNIITKAFAVYDAREITAKQAVRTDILEMEDELLLLMDELGMTETHWESLKHQTHRTIGNRYVNVMFYGDKIKPFADAVSGRSSIIRTKAVDQVSFLIKDLMTAQELNDFFIHWGVPTTLLLGNQQSKKDLVYSVLLALSSTGDPEDKTLLFRIFEEVVHPLNFAGDTKKAKEIELKITKLLRYDGLSLLGGKVHTFDKSDETVIEDFEKKQNTVDPALAESLDSIFGGNIFEAAFVPPRPHSKQPVPKASEPPATQPEVRSTHIHIHNDNNITQSLQLPNVDTAEREEPTKPKKSLKDAFISFDDDLTSIVIDGKNCRLPPHKNEHLFCRAVFEYKKGEPIDWSIISEKMTGKQWGESADEGAKKDKRAVIDTMYAVNKRVAETYGTDDQMLAWNEKTVTRMF